MPSGGIIVGIMQGSDPPIAIPVAVNADGELLTAAEVDSPAQGLELTNQLLVLLIGKIDALGTTINDAIAEAKADKERN